MNIKLFGKSIFEFNKNKGSIYWVNSNDSLKKSAFLPNFYTQRANQSVISSTPEAVIMTPEEIIPTANRMKKDRKNKKKLAKIDKPMNIQLTPKGVYEMKLLNDESFKLKTDKNYIEDQLSTFKDKLGLIKISEADYTRGITEISSIIIRLENRKKYSQFKNYFENYPYTTTDRIEKLTKEHNYLRLGLIEQFIADMPKEAIKEMKDYENNTKKLCDKKPIFYIIADKKDFEKLEKRKDPILLAQSPFGHFWQILGAWDKEMLIIDEL